MSEPGVRIEHRDAISILTIDNTKQRNALSMPVKESLIAALEAARDRAATRAIVLVGAEGTFSAGGDISKFPSMTPQKGRWLVMHQRRILHLLIHGTKPIVAAVEGFAFGAGFGLAMVADHVVAAKNAKFCASFNRIGLLPDGGLMWTLPQRIGSARAREMFMLASVVDGEEGGRIGMVDTVVEPGTALEAAIAKAAQFADGPPEAIAIMRGVFAQWPFGLDTALEFEADGQAILFNTEDCQGAARAFLEKRRPEFHGR